MKAYELEARLSSLLNKGIILDGKSGKLLRYTLGEKTMKLTLDTQDIVILNEDIEDSMERIQTQALVARPEVTQTSVIQRTGSRLEKILMDNIQKVQQDKDYIPQAREVNTNIKSLIDLAKTEVEYMKTLAYFNKGKR